MKCFIFDCPAHRKFLIQQEQVQEQDLNPEFIDQVAEFCSYIFSHSEAKVASQSMDLMSHLCLPTS